MYFFAYNGENLSCIAVAGPCLSVRVPLKSGGFMTFTAPNQTTGFVKGQTINPGEPIADERALRVLRADPRFTEVSS
jgi:hypothetical protein